MMCDVDSMDALDDAASIETLSSLVSPRARGLLNFLKIVQHKFPGRNSAEGCS